MKKILVTFFALLFCLTSSVGYSQDFICEYTNYTCEEVEYLKLTKRNEIFFKFFSNTPFTGLVKGKCCEKKPTAVNSYMEQVTGDPKYNVSV